MKCGLLYRKQKYILSYKYLYFENMYMDEPNGEPYPNLVGKFKFESNFILAEPEPCDLSFV
jgi:hypothetical protein